MAWIVVVCCGENGELVVGGVVCLGGKEELVVGGVEGRESWWLVVWREGRAGGWCVVKGRESWWLVVWREGKGELVAGGVEGR